MVVTHTMERRKRYKGRMMSTMMMEINPKRVECPCGVCDRA